jgi:hypothetical protein
VIKIENILKIIQVLMKGEENEGESEREKWKNMESRMEGIFFLRRTC